MEDYLAPTLILAASLSLGQVIAVADEASEIAAIEAAMNRLGKAFVSEDVTTIKTLITPDHIAIGPTCDGPVSIDE